MWESRADMETGGTDEGATVPDLLPWSQVGWIFRDGDCIAIERKGPHLRSRVLAD
jgi:hypothetical protein